MGCLWSVIGGYALFYALAHTSPVMPAALLLGAGVAYLFASVRIPRTWLFIKALLLLQVGYVLYVAYWRIPKEAVMPWGFVLLVVVLMLYTFTTLGTSTPASET